MSAQTPPPPPPSTVDPDSSTPPPPPYDLPKKSRTGLVIALVAGLLVLVVVAVVVVVLVADKGEATHSIRTPATAGGMKRDPAKESELRKGLDTVLVQFKGQSPGLKAVKSAVYNQDDAKRGPKGALVFFGGSRTKPSAKNISTFLGNIRKLGSTNGLKITSVPVGDAGGKAVCAAQTTGQKIAVCAWATRDTVGELVPTVAGYDATQLAKIMADLRSDVEKTN